MADGSAQLSEAPYYGALAEAPGGRARWLVADDGVRLRVVEWPREGARGTVVIFPGRTEFSEKYGRVAVDLSQRGLASVAIDWRGQGLADRLLPDPTAGHVGTFADYQRDARALFAHLEASDFPKPWILVGHSMGGCIGLRTLMGDHPFVAAAFSAPMWGIQLNPLVAPFAGILAQTAVGIGAATAYPPGQAGLSYFDKIAFSDNKLTTDPDSYLYMKRMAQAEPDLMIGGPTYQWLSRALSETVALHRMPSPDLPAIVFLGTDEQIIDPARIHGRMSRWPKGTLDVQPNLRHEMLMEAPDVRRPILDKIAALI